MFYLIFLERVQRFLKSLSFIHKEYIFFYIRDCTRYIPPIFFQQCFRRILYGSSVSSFSRNYALRA